VLPGINPNELAQLEKQTSEGVLSLLNMFSGGAFSNASVFALGIMPYISASIVVQLIRNCSTLFSEDYSAKVKVEEKN
jgi:preprotein translocase subunit SecY